ADTEHRPHCCEWRAVSAGLRQLRRVHRDAHGADHGSLPVPSATWIGRAATSGEQHRPTTGASDVAVLAKACWLRHHADRQMASRVSAEIWAAAEWLRPLLRLSWR